MNIRVLINGVDRTAQIKPSLSITDNINSTRDSVDFEALAGAWTPARNDAIAIEIDGDITFAGVITRVAIRSAIGRQIEYDCVAADMSFLLDRKLVLKRYRDMTVDAIIDALLTEYDTEGFTTVAVNCPKVLGSVTFNRITIGKAIEKLAKAVGYAWYVDANKDIHFFARNDEVAPFNLDDTSGNYQWESLEVQTSLDQIRNRIVIEGGEEQGVTTTETITVSSASADERKMVRLAAKFAAKPVVKIGGVTKTVGIEYLDADGSYDVMWSYAEKYLRFIADPGAGAVITATGNPLYSIILQAENTESIGLYGAWEFVIRDNNIRSKDEAKQRAKAELSAYQNGIAEASFKTNRSGLRSGQVITIDSAARGVSENFMIQRVRFAMVSAEDGEWTVTLASMRSINLIEFLEGLINPGEYHDDENETLLALYEREEFVGIVEDIIQGAVTFAPYRWGTTLYWSMGTWQ